MVAKNTNRIADVNGDGHYVMRMPARKPACLTITGYIPAEANAGHEAWVGYAQVEALLGMKPKWNPKGRTKVNDFKSGIRALAKSIQEIGLSQFPVINFNIVVDGNRRVKAFKFLDLETIPVVYRPCAGPTTFCEIQEHSKHHQRYQRAESWLINPGAVTYGMNAKLNRAAELLSLDTVKWVTRKKGMSVLSLLTWAEKAWEYTRPAVEMKEFLRKAVIHMAEFNEQKLVRDWVKTIKGSPCVLADHILQGKPLRCAC